jgi:hypothetical protein
LTGTRPFRVPQFLARSPNAQDNVCDRASLTDRIWTLRELALPDALRKSEDV